MTSLVLASASPRRQVLVGLLELPWRPAPPGIQEEQYLLDDPLVAALNVAVAKARAVAPSPTEIVLAADTLVVEDGKLVGKPADAEQARAMLGHLRGRTHLVVTGVALRTASGLVWGGVVSTLVTLRDYADAELAAYLERGEPFDKAGGYAIQDTAFRPVDKLDGCYLNVVGLPLCAVATGLASLGVRLGIEGRGSTIPPCAFCRRGEGLVAVRSGT